MIEDPWADPKTQAEFHEELDLDGEEIWNSQDTEEIDQKFLEPEWWNPHKKARPTHQGYKDFLKTVCKVAFAKAPVKIKIRDSQIARMKEFV